MRRRVTRWFCADPDHSDSCAKSSVSSLRAARPWVIDGPNPTIEGNVYDDNDEPIP